MHVAIFKYNYILTIIRICKYTGGLGVRLHLQQGYIAIYNMVIAGVSIIKDGYKNRPKYSS